MTFIKKVTALAVSNISPANYQGALIWQSDNDLPGIDKTTVRFQITPSDGNIGFPLETDDFHLDNNLLPSVQMGAISTLQSGSILIPMTIRDTEGDTIHIFGRYQKESDAWRNITFSGSTQFLSDDYVNMLEWNSVDDLGFGEFKTIRIQLIPVDKDSGDVSVSNIFNIYNYAGDYTADLKIDFNDLIVFARAWSDQDLTKEIGPAAGEPPLLIPIPDNKFDFEDLMVLVQQWNWSYDNVDSVLKGPVLSKISKNNVVKSEVKLETFVRDNTIRYVWEKEIELTDHDSHLSPVNEHLITVFQSNYDLWSNEFGDELIFALDSISQILGLQLQLDYDPHVMRVSQTDNYLLHEQNGFTLQHTNSETGQFLLNTVILEKKEKQLKCAETLFRIKIIPVEERQTSVSYRWKVYGINGTVISQGGDDIQLTVHYAKPRQYALYQNFPNPFNPSTTIRYQLPVDSKVHLEIFNILGEQVTTLVDEFQKAGYYSRLWDISESNNRIASGIYFVRFLATSNHKNKYIHHKKIIVLK